MIGILTAVAILAMVVHESVTYRRFLGAMVGLDDVVKNAIPSIMHLAQIRSELRTVREEADAALGAPAPERSRLKRRVMGTLASADEQWNAYVKLPPFVGERSKQLALQQSLATIRSQSEEFFDAADPVDAVRALEKRLIPAMNEADGLAKELVEVNAQAALDGAVNVAWKQQDALRLSVVMLASVLGMLAVVAVFAERYLARAEAEALHRLDDLDAFAGRVAHDLRGLLTPCLFAIAAIRRDPGSIERTLAHLDRLERGLGRSTSLLDELLEFSRAGARIESGARASVDDVVGDVVAAVR
ncbi:MAG TPA: MCP four helix bundle domain-containing protein, partial [Planctomycetota bacterium]|nr:MCP four helix bundle domain-containing protein [Planctomycetota bacterium]